MKPDWDSLASSFEGSPKVLIADVDCTAGGKPLCDKFGVRGYPTIKYFNSENPDGKDYSGGRSFDALKEFVSENLEVKCLLDNTEGCSDKEKDFMGKWKAKDKADVSAQLERLNKMVGGTMAPDLKKWVAQRISILKQLSEA